MTTVRTNAAASMLGVSPNTLRSWERRFGYPTPRRTAGGHRQFDVRELEALREAFEQTHNVSSAVRLARERGPGPASPRRLRSALMRYDEDEADRVLEESLMVRSIERTVEEVLLPGVELIATPVGEPPSPEHGFAWRWASALDGDRAPRRAAGRARGGRAHPRREPPARRRRAARAGARAAAAPRRRARAVPRVRLRARPPRAGAGDADAARRPAHRAPRVAGRARPARLRRQAIGRPAWASSTSAARCRRAAPRPCPDSGRGPPLPATRSSRTWTGARRTAKLSVRPPEDVRSRTRWPSCRVTRWPTARSTRCCAPRRRCAVG